VNSKCGLSVSIMLFRIDVKELRLIFPAAIDSD